MSLQRVMRFRKEIKKEKVAEKRIHKPHNPPLPLDPLQQNYSINKHDMVLKNKVHIEVMLCSSFAVRLLLFSL